jgi:hypothetical protein
LWVTPAHPDQDIADAGAEDGQMPAAELAQAIGAQEGRAFFGHAAPGWRCIGLGQGRRDFRRKDMRVLRGAREARERVADKVRRGAPLHEIKAVLTVVHPTIPRAGRRTSLARQAGTMPCMSR